MMTQKRRADAESRLRKAHATLGAAKALQKLLDRELRAVDLQAAARSGTQPSAGGPATTRP